MLESRELLEVQVARLAALRADDEHLPAVMASCRDSAGTWDDNIRFHAAVARCTGNFMLERLVRLQMDLLSEVHQRDHYRSAQAGAELLAEHRAIADAVAARDPEAAAAAMRRHFAHTRAAVESP